MSTPSSSIPALANAPGAHPQTTFVPPEPGYFGAPRDASAKPECSAFDAAISAPSNIRRRGERLTVEEWWEKMMRLLAEKMKQSAVAHLQIDLTEMGTYKFEVTPISDVPSLKNQQPGTANIEPRTDSQTHAEA